MTAINAIARHRRPEDMPDWGLHVGELTGWPVAERSAELVGLVLAGRLDLTVPVDESDALALLVLSQAYGHECGVTLAVEHWLALHIDADPDLGDGFLSGAEYTMDRVDRQNTSIWAQQSEWLRRREPARSLELKATGVVVCGCLVRFEAVASTGEPYTHTRRWMRDDPEFVEGEGEEVFEPGPETCADCLTFSAGPVVYVDCPSCTGWRDAATG
ncbi:hypothetical protein LN042_36650 [Kitasatospora sp. RB6PN24]|uniref:hypothetical protein n=1 Tax=Kitasatospora humi TaxID=2893891 RepID=UPI001E64387A|nr:hypothetical protein [Kitasatospora humi]MCC9312520.1 hypothetical protein [Kitasatospora humi]